MIVLIRHAERGDNQFPKILSQIPYDPPITVPGIQSIQQAVDQISPILKLKQIKRIRVISSKFLRCIMTAEHILTKLAAQGYQTEGSWVIEPLLSEYLRSEWFQTYPLQELIMDTEYRSKYIKKDCWVNPQSMPKLKFPENFVVFHDRLEKFKNKLVFPESGTCLLVVTHGLVVRGLCWKMNIVPNILAEIKYCGYAIFEKDKGKEKLTHARL